MSKTLIVNLFGGAGCGKSTIAAGIFYELKKQKISCELVTEYAKSLVWEERDKTFENQLYIFAKQHHRLFSVLNKVDVIITDSPLLLTPIYDAENRIDLEKLTINEYNKCTNLNLFVTRKTGYTISGRIHTLDESIQVDNRIRQFLQKYNIPFEDIDINTNISEEIIPWILYPLVT